MMNENSIKKASLYKLANRLYVLSSMKQNKRVVDEYNSIVDEMWSRSETLKGDKGVKKIERKKKHNERHND